MDSNASHAGEVERKVWQDNDFLLPGQLLKMSPLVDRPIRCVNPAKAQAAAPCRYWHWSHCAACRAREPVPGDREPIFYGTAARLASCSAAVPVFPSNIHGIERFWMGSLFGVASSRFWGSATSGRLGRVTVLPQLKVDRLCSVVDGTADFDPNRPSLPFNFGVDLIFSISSREHGGSGRRKTIHQVQRPRGESAPCCRRQG